MATEEGRVLSADNNKAWIQTTRSAACEACKSRHTCHTMGGGNDMTVEAINKIGAREGDQVVVEFNTSSLLKGTFLIYIFPILGLLFGAGIGVKLSPIAGLDESALSAIIGLSAFALSLLIVILIGNRLGKKESYQPKIIRVKKTLPLD